MGVNWSSEHSEIVLISILASLMILILPLLALFAGGDTSQYLIQTITYLAIGAVSLLMIYIMKNEEIRTKGRSYVTTYIYDPEKGVLQKLFPKLSFGLFVSVLVIVFTIAGFYSVYANTFFFSPPTYKFQISPAGDVFLQAEPAAMSESLLFLLILSIAVSAIKYFAGQQRLGRGVVPVLIYLVAPIITTAFVFAYHLARYGADEKGLFFVLLLGFIGSLMTLLSGSFIPWYLWHFSNNLFIGLNKYMSNEALPAIAFIVLLLEVLLLVVVPIYLRLGKKGRVRSHG